MLWNNKNSHRMEWHSINIRNIHKEPSSNNPDQESAILNGTLHDFTSVQSGKCWECLNTLRTGDADLRFYVSTVQDGWRKSAFLTCTWFPRTIHLITQYMKPFTERSC